MNQKSLQGFASDMEDAVFFKATPQNIAALLAAHRWANFSAIGTVDDKTFLTARMGLIDICPDQSYLAQKLLPVYAPCLMDLDKGPTLETVAQEAAQAEPCPVPDWKYLRWEGYSDQRYQAIQQGKWENGLPKPWLHLTASPDGRVLKQDYAFPQVNDPKVARLCPWLAKNHVAALVAEADQFCEFPLYRFNLPLLREMDPMGFLRHEQTMAFCDSILPDEEPPYQQQMQ